MTSNRSFWEIAACDWTDDSSRIFPVISATARSTLLFAQELGKFRVSPSYYTERAHLNSYLLLCTTSGHGVLEYDGSTYHLTEGSVFLIDCERYHRYCSDMADGYWAFTWVHCNGRTMQGLYDEIMRSGFRIFTPESDDVFRLADEIVYYHQRKDPKSEIITYRNLSAIFAGLMLSNPTYSDGGEKITEDMLAVKKYLEKHFKEDLGIDAISERFGISRSHLSRQFKKMFGITMKDYLIGLRLSYAKELLLYTTMSVEEITYQCGMNYPSHFIAMFRSREHTTPEQFRLSRS